jgi:N-methylhydantoinase A
MTNYILAIDVGGTFTDVICFNTETGAAEIAKAPSTPPDFIGGMINGITALGIKPAEISLIKIGTTIATNTIIMRTGARTALVTTLGFTDVLHAARAARPTLYDSDWDPAPALVSRRDTHAVRQRTTYEGEEIEALDETGLRAIAVKLRDQGIKAVAVSFLHSYINGSHERQARDILLEEISDAYVSLSSDILPEIREFERTSTTVANAYLGPVLDRYLSALAERLKAFGYSGPLLIMHSGGGVMSVEAAREIPARICQSGPAAGVMAGANLGQVTGRPNVINLDVGGTSADVSLARGGRPLIRAEWNVDFNIVINFPSVDVATIGAGGGSIARVDAGGVLKVGPDSAGARPGPACYGHGGEAPTVTDANLVLGRLSGDTKLAGQVALRSDLAEQAVASVSGPLNCSLEQAAAGILQIMRANMAGAIRLMSVRRGHDPRTFALAAFGGAGPLHALELAVELRIPEVIIPYVPGLGSALGVLSVEVRHDFVQSIFATNTRFDVAELNAAFSKLEARARARLVEEGVPDDRLAIHRQLDVRYYGQVSGGLTLDAGQGILSEADVSAIFDSFHVQHTEEYGYTLPPDLAELEIVNARVNAEGQQSAPAAPLFLGKRVDKVKPSGTRQVYFDDWTETAIYQRAELPAGCIIAGPAVIEQIDSTTLLIPGSSATVDERHNLICSVG